MSTNSEISTNIGNNLDNEVIIRNIDDNETYQREILVNANKLSKIEKKGKITLEDGQDIKDNLSQQFKRLFDRENILFLGKFVEELPIQIKQATGNTVLPFIAQQILEEKLSKIPKKDRTKIKYIHFGKAQIIIKPTIKSGIDTPIEIIVYDRRITSNNINEIIIGRLEGNLGYPAVKFDVSLQIGIPIISNYLGKSIGLSFRYLRQDLMNQDDYPFNILYAVGYGLSNSHYSVNFKTSNKIEIEQIFAETSTKLIEIPRSHFSLPKLTNGDRIEETSENIFRNYNDSTALVPKQGFSLNRSQSQSFRLPRQEYEIPVEHPSSIPIILEEPTNIHTVINTQKDLNEVKEMIRKIDNKL